MLILILLVVIINFYISFKINFVSTTNFFLDVIIVSINQTYRMSWYGFFACFLVHTLVGIARKSINELTSSYGWIIVRVGTVITCCLGCWFQYQLFSTCIEQIYYVLTTNSSAVIICIPWDDRSEERRVTG